MHTINSSLKTHGTDASDIIILAASLKVKINASMCMPCMYIMHGYNCCMFLYTISLALAC